MSDVMTVLSQELDAISYDWMVGQHPELLDAIEKAVAKGVNDVEIKRAVYRQTGRIELALRCQQCARHVARE